MPTPYSYVVQTSVFERHLELFTRLRSTGQLLPEITFDDGHVSDLTEALPVLDRYGAKADFFITVGWTGERAGYMNWAELRELHAAGQRIGAHGWTHTLLTHCTPQQLDHELRGARLALEDGLSAAVTTMSLPGGRANGRVLEAAREAGYRHIFTSQPKAEPSEPGPTVGRLNVRGDMTTDWLARLFDPGSGILAALERQDRVKQTAKRLLGDRIYAQLWAVLNRHSAESSPAEALE